MHKQIWGFFQLLQHRANLLHIADGFEIAAAIIFANYTKKPTAAVAGRVFVYK